MTNNKRQILIKRISCVVYSAVKLRTNEAENSSKFKNSQPQPKIYVSCKKKDLEGFWLHNACYHNFVKRMGTRSKSFEGIWLILELAALNCFLLLYHAPGRISGTSNQTADFLPNDPGIVRK